MTITIKYHDITVKIYDPNFSKHTYSGKHSERIIEMLKAATEQIKTLTK